MTVVFMMRGESYPFKLIRFSTIERVIVKHLKRGAFFMPRKGDDYGNIGTIRTKTTEGRAQK